MERLQHGPKYLLPFHLQPANPLPYPMHGGETTADASHGLRSAYHLSIRLAEPGFALSVVFIVKAYGQDRKAQKG
ncbi:MAG: hypothetical protein M1823_007911, partial [Watsoniomyces obsoletus]